MADYRKWDNISDSEEEEEKKRSKLQSLYAEEQQELRDEQATVEKWLRKQEVHILAGRDAPLAKPPELREQPQARMAVRRLSKEERKVVAMLIVVSHFEEGETNLDRHPQMLDLVRHNRWLEEDPGTLELLCRVHNYSMKLSGSKPRPEDEDIHVADTPLDNRMRSMTLCAINTLNAPKKCKCPGGLLELVNEVCTPNSEQAQERRLKWQKKDFGKDALFESLFPDMKQYTDDSSDSGWAEIGLFAAVILLLIGVVVLIFYMNRLAPSPSARNESAAALKNTVAAMAKLATGASEAPAATAGLSSAAASAAALGAGGADIGTGADAGGNIDAAAAAAESQRKIEELTRQIDELKAAQAASASAAAGGDRAVGDEL